LFIVLLWCYNNHVFVEYAQSQSVTVEMQLAAFAQWTRSNLHVLTYADGHIRRRRFTVRISATGLPVLPPDDSPQGYCLVSCQLNGVNGYRVARFKTAVQHVQEQLQKEQKRKRYTKRSPCSCKENGMDCGDFDLCACRKANKKCVVACHGDDHSDCKCAAPKNQYKRMKLNVKPPVRKARARNILDDDPDYVYEGASLDDLSDNEWDISNVRSSLSDVISTANNIDLE
jgi:hypothetical protein